MIKTKKRVKTAGDNSLLPGYNQAWHISFSTKLASYEAMMGFSGSRYYLILKIFNSGLVIYRSSKKPRFRNLHLIGALTILLCPIMCPLFYIYLLFHGCLETVEYLRRSSIEVWVFKLTFIFVMGFLLYYFIANELLR